MNTVVYTTVAVSHEVRDYLNALSKERKDKSVNATVEFLINYYKEDRDNAGKS